MCGNDMRVIQPEGDKEWRHVCNSCGYIDYFNPKLVVGCIIEHEGKILLCRRYRTQGGLQGFIRLSLRPDFSDEC
jgi:NADH pyrophosphatase NudC (nudix superfamily)